MKHSNKEYILPIVTILLLFTCMGTLIYGLYATAKIMDFDHTVTHKIEVIEKCEIDKTKLTYTKLTKEQRHNFYMSFCDKVRPNDITSSYDDLGNIGSFWCKYHSGYTQNHNKMIVENYIKNQTIVYKVVTK